MSKINRATQKLFGTGAGSNTFTQFGALAASYPSIPTQYPGSGITPALVQALSAFSNSWSSAVVSGSAPSIQDMNALFYLAFYQISYSLQQGIPEYDSGTTYFTNGFCSSSGIVYQSLIDNNTGNSPSSSPSDWAIFSAQRKAPTVQKFTSSSGTYTLPSGALYIRVRMVGGSGGGGGSGTGSNGAGGAGGNSTFGTSLLVANGGSAQSNSNVPVSGGTASLGSGPIGIAYQGASGGGAGQSTTANTDFSGGMGGTSPFGGAGGGAASAAAGINAIANSGSGGGGAGAPSAGTAGAGGAAGGFVDAIISSPSATYAYAVGAAGSFGIAGTSGYAGGSGAAGIIIVEEYYN